MPLPDLLNTTREECAALAPDRVVVRSAATAPPAWCEVHQHYKWCGHNGGFMGPGGYRAQASESIQKDLP